MTWLELAQMAQRGRIKSREPLRAWLAELARDVRSMPVTPAIAATAVGLGESFPGDRFDRVIYVTAIENGWQLVTRDQRLHDFPSERTVAIW